MLGLLLGVRIAAAEQPLEDYWSPCWVGPGVVHVPSCIHWGEIVYSPFHLEGPSRVPVMAPAITLRQNFDREMRQSIWFFATAVSDEEG